MKVSDLIYKIISKNISTAYLFSGGSIMPLIDKFHNLNNYNNMKFYIPTNESSAGFCSIGHNKSKNKLDSVVITTSGPGLTNVLTPLTDAYCDRVPLLVISGDVSTHMMGKDAFQEAPSIALTKPITHWNHSLSNAEEVIPVFNKAFKLINQNKQVHINIPKDILSLSAIHNQDIINENITNDIILNKELIKHVAYLINNSKKPVLYIGRGCIEASKLLTRFAKLADIPVTTTLHGLGIFNETEDLSLKMVGMHGSVRANMAIQNADCIICIGARFDDRTTGNVNKYAPNAKYIIHINTDKTTFGKVIKNTINIHGYSNDVIEEMLKYINKNRHCNWLSFLKKYPNNFQFNDITLKQQSILTMINEELTNDIRNKSLFTTGVGNHQMYTAQLIDHILPNNFITSGSLGTMGSSNSLAIGAKIANPNKIVFSIDGDQSFNMMNDLKMILNYNIPIKMVIMNDSKQSMVNVWEKLFFDNRITATETINPDYNLLGKAYGIKVITISKNLNYKIIKKKIKKFINYDYNQPIILNCIVESDYCLPLVPPGNGLDEMITYNNFNDLINIDKSSAPS